MSYSKNRLDFRLCAKSRLKKGAALSLMVATALHPAYAQTDEADNENSWGAGTIVVTAKRDGYTLNSGSSATRTNTPLINVPQSVQVLNSSLIRDQDRRTLGEALVNVSGIVATKPEESAIAQPLIRGFSSEIFLDGLPAFSFNAIADPTSLTGVDRIEVVKGPTSTVYGGGAGAPLGGLINVVSVRPEDKFGGYVAMRAGSFSTYNPYADINLPLSASIAARVTAEYQHNKSWIDKVNGYRWSVQPSLRFRVDDQTELLLRGKYDRRVQLEYSGLPAAAALAGELDPDAFPGAPVGQPRSTIVNKMLTAELRHDFRDGLRLTVTGRYYHNRYDQYGSFAYPDLAPPDPSTPTVYPIFPVFLPVKVKQFTSDANLLADVEVLGGQHEFLFGVNYDHTRDDQGMFFDFFRVVGLQDLANPNYDLSFGGGLPALSLQDDKFETVAGYIQDQATYGPVHFSGSLRYTRLTWRRFGTTGNFDVTYSRLTPRVGATFDVTEGAALFAGFATGFHGAILSGPTVTSIRPEISRSLEAGLKIALPRQRIWGTFAVYEQKRRNVSMSDPDPTNFGLSIQVGEQRSRGIEADITWEPTRSLSILANYAYTQAKVIRDYPQSVIDAANANGVPLARLVGNRLARVPKHSGRVAVHYRVLSGPAKGLSFGAGVTALSSRETYLPNLTGTLVSGYAVVDAQMSYDFGRFTVTVSGSNLTNHNGFDTYQYLSPVVIPIQPRSGYIMFKTRL